MDNKSHNHSAVVKDPLLVNKRPRLTTTSQNHLFSVVTLLHTELAGAHVEWSWPGQASRAIKPPCFQLLFEQ